MTRQQGPIPEPISQLQQQLTQWRSSNRPRTRLPEALWNAAVELAREYGIYRTAHPLRLDYTDLKERLLGRQRRPAQPRRKTTQPAFVELHTSLGQQADQCVIEFESSRGNKMRVQCGIRALDWPLLLRAWRDVEA